MAYTSFDITKRVKASGPQNAKLAVVGMAPASEEIAQGIPFVGAAGRRLNAALGAYKISRTNDVYVTNIVEFPIRVGTSIFDLPPYILQKEVERVTRELKEVKPNCVILCGNEPLQVFTGKKGIQKWRGSILPSTIIPGQKCLATVHPAWILRGMFKWEPVFAHIDIKRGIEQSLFPEIRPPKREALTGPSFRTVIDYLRECNEQKRISFDIETSWYTANRPGHIACFGIGYRKDQALCIPFVRQSGVNYWTLEEEAAIWQLLATVLANSKIEKIGHNLAFDWMYMWLAKIYPRFPRICTMLLHHCLYPDFGAAKSEWSAIKPRFDEPGHGLAFVTSHYTETPYYKDDGRQWRPEYGEHAFWAYNCMDVMIPIEVAEKMETEAHEEDVWEYFIEHYMDSFLNSLRMEWFGVAIDIAKRAIAKTELEARVQELQRSIDKTLGWHLNVNSPKQMSALLYKTKGYQPRYKVDKRSGKRSVTSDKYALQHFADKYQDEVLRYIQDLRGVLDLKGDIVEQELGEDGRMHSHYKLGGTDGARWSSVRSILGTGTNLQNVPWRYPIARQLFIPK
ncbi:MAG TPA: DNA polymerase [Candidatus Hodarchaeales archaeon]|nr:DNA polymerase [Candidatus Hodarchaeales archaeon]